jgi:prepilin-type N-terminal cleavage/methylation domain-containing protein
MSRTSNPWKPYASRHIKRAFTLTELLIVVAVIALLAAILFPVYASARRSAKRTDALSNVSQIGLACHLYLADNDDTLPFRFPQITAWPGYDSILFLASDPGMAGPYGPYLKSSQVWFSPEDRLNDRGYTSFTFNEQLAFSWPISQVARPAEAIYMTDRTDVANGLPGPVDTYVWWQFTDQIPFTLSSLPGKLDPVSVATQIDPIRYIGDTAAFLFLDSHVAALQFDRTWGNAQNNLHYAFKS